MSQKGNCWDNACAESFFKMLKREMETQDDKHTPGEGRQSVFMYLEAYYNRIRIHSVLDMVQARLVRAAFLFRSIRKIVYNVPTV
jgi:putative transposase